MIHQHPFSSLTPSAQKKAFALLTFFTLVVMLALTILGAPLRTAHAPLGILSFEFAKTLSRAHQMIDSWGQTGQVYAAFNLGLDYLFLVLYPISIALGCALISESLVHKQRLLSGTGTVLSWLQFGAGGLDVVENVALIRILFGSNQSVRPELAWWCALLKFIIVFAGLGYIVVGTTRMLIEKLFTNKGPNEKTEEENLST